MSNDINCCNSQIVDTYIRHFENLLIPFEDENLIPENSFIFYEMSGRKFYILRKNYDSFLNIYMRIQTHNHLVIDLNSAITQILCLDIDVTNMDNTVTHYIIKEYIDNILIPKLKIIFKDMYSLTILISQKSATSGFHVFFPEIIVSNDDYHHFCNLFRTMFNYHDDKISLDIPVNFNMPYACKLNETRCYMPTLLILIFNDKTYKIYLDEADSVISATCHYIKDEFKKAKKLFGSPFYLYLSQSPDTRHKLLFNFMLPVNRNTGFKQFNLLFKTTVSHISTSDNDNNVVFADVEMELPNGQIAVRYIHKESHFTLKEDRILKPVHTFLKMQVFRIRNLTTVSIPMKRWFNRFKGRMQQIVDNIFQNINRRLLSNNLHLIDCENPLKSVIMFRSGTFFAPVFYSLINVLKMSSTDLCEELMIYFDHSVEEENHILTFIRKMSELNPNLIKNIAQGFTFDTILYCGDYMNSSELNPYQKIDRILENNNHNFVDNMTQQYLISIVNQIMEVSFPVRKQGRKRYFWNSIKGEWVTCSMEEMKNIFGFVADRTVAHCETLTGKKMSSTIIRDKCLNYYYFLSIMENQHRNFRLDYRKFLILTPEGALDLILGSIGIPVPELFLSDKVILSHIDTFDDTLQSEHGLHSLHQTLWTPEFFHRYVDALVKSNADYMLVLKSLTDRFDDCHYYECLLNAYIHFCKFLHFDYEEMRYFLHVLASCLIARNYAKQLIFLQGDKDNGKSRVFKILKLVFNTYAVSADCEVFNVNRRSETKPEIASQFREARVLLCEELSGTINQNYLKLLSSDSLVSCRDLYEKPVSGIPTLKLFFCTNKPPSVITTAAFKERIVVFNFKSKFLSEKVVPQSIRKQIRNNIYERDFNETKLTEVAFGFFLSMYYLYRDNFSRETGLLHFPKTPESMVEFKESYLKNADLYMQFKTLMDVQIIPGETTLASDLKTAVRYFLRLTKLTTTVSCEELIDQFDVEFSIYKRQSNESEFISDSEEDSDKEEKENSDKEEKENSDKEEEENSDIEEEENSDIEEENNKKKMLLAAKGKQRHPNQLAAFTNSKQRKRKYSSSSSEDDNDEIKKSHDNDENLKVYVQYVNVAIRNLRRYR